jgi:hypothetical protein
VKAAGGAEPITDVLVIVGLLKEEPRSTREEAKHMHRIHPHASSQIVPN